MNTNERPIGTATESEQRWRTVQRLELLVFLFLVVPSLALSFFALPSARVGFVTIAWATILRDLALVSLVAFFLWRNEEPVSAIGWMTSRAEREFTVGVVLFFPLLVVTDTAEQMFRRAGLSAPSTPLPAFLTTSDSAQVVLAVLLVTVVAVAEETIFRGYLIRRFAAVTGSRGIAVVASALVFSLGHGYEGTAGVATVGVMGFALGLVYLWRRSLVAPIVMHFLQDFIAIVAAPWLTHVR